MLVYLKAIALRVSFFLSNKMMDSSESDERTTTASSDLHVYIGSWDSEMRDEIDLIHSTFS